jgi:hypothetical protein
MNNTWRNFDAEGNEKSFSRSQANSRSNADVDIEKDVLVLYHLPLLKNDMKEPTCLNILTPFDTFPTCVIT